MGAGCEDGCVAVIEQVRPVVDALRRPLHDLRISVTDKCNLRCTYCMPVDHYHDRYEFLAREELLTFEEIVRIARVFVDAGVLKLRITGGEPLLRKDLPVLIAMLRAIPGVNDLALTTNGILLPQFASPLKHAGLDRVTVSLDSIDDDVFQRMNGRGVRVQTVLDGIRAAEDAGLGPIKINSVVQRCVNDSGVVDLAARFRGTGAIVRFIEYMDVGTCNGWREDAVVPSRELRDRIAARFPIGPIGPNYHGEVAERYRYLDGAGELGFISSVSQPFCGACSRARLSADGQLFTCLFGSSGADLRTLLRGAAPDDVLADRIGEAWRARRDRYSELRAGHSLSAESANKVEMYHIGG
ncbi:MAG: GTP 3',8-cyclase MoaA [Candidatus Hydrogenedentes bacterium]|nr:GTP 3',8-cyclase MoaA [Candidatus Hydrogenedentota bacterium]